MKMSKESINWDKLIEYLDAGNGQFKELSDLNQAEVEILRYAEAMNNTLKGQDLATQFPAKQGWKEFSNRRRRKFVYKLMAYAAAILLVIGVGFWMNSTVIKPAPSALIAGTENLIKLTLTDGEERILYNEEQSVEDAGSRIAYNTELISYEDVSDDQQLVKAGMNRLEVPFGRRTEVLLSDGTRIWVNAGTVLEYPTRFDGSKREVYVTGEAYFDVKHDSEKAFIVHVGELEVQVLGTSFGINTFNSKVKTALVEGSVMLQVGQHKKQLQPGEIGTYDLKTLSLSKNNNDIRQWVAWKDNILYFDDMKLIDIVDKLSREYDCQFVFDDLSLEELRFTVDINRVDELSRVLSYLTLSAGNVKFELKDKVVHIRSI